MRVLTAAQTKEAEQKAVDRGTSFEQLMENAGRASAQGLQQLALAHQKEPRILLLCGNGNNAGDAFVIARLLAQEGWQVEYVPLLGPPYSPLAQLNLQRMGPEISEQTLQSADFSSSFVVDGVFGTGFHGELPLLVQQAFAKARCQAITVALDLPSGLVCDSGAIAPGTFEARYTFTFGAQKPGLLLPGNEICTGTVQVLDIGI